VGAPRSLARLTLESDALRLVACPELGGRIVSLVDRRSGREWLVQGIDPAAAAPWAAEEAIFGGAEAFGWDECLPTVAPCADPLDPDGPSLRDHGDQWGRAASQDVVASSLVTAWPVGRWPYRFERRIELNGGVVDVAYRLVNDGPRDLPFLWSMHALLALDPGAVVRIEEPGAARLTAAHGYAVPPDPACAEWLVPSAPTATFVKAYTRLRPPGRVSVRQPDGAVLEVDWDLAVAPVAGIWLDFGGWPPGGPPGWQAAIEPTTSEDDDLASAIDAGRARILTPGGEVRWFVRLDFG
jgi:hypothetical protein